MLIPLKSQINLTLLNLTIEKDLCFSENSNNKSPDINQVLS